MRRVHTGAAGVGCLLGLLLASPARAGLMTDGVLRDETYFNPGILFGFARRSGETVGTIGVELSVHRFLPTRLGVGGFVQAQWMGSKSGRFGGGVQFTAPQFQSVGLELGGTYETSNPRFAGTTSLHLAPFFSLGIVGLGVRLGIPVHAAVSRLPGRGFEWGLNMTIKIPQPLKKKDRYGS